MTPLCELARKYGTDKGGEHTKYASGRCHNYTPFYYEMWKNRREEPLTILEVGSQNGHSIQMWREFFPNAKIFGWDIDITQYSYPEDPRVKIMQVPIGRFYDWVIVPGDDLPMLAALAQMGSPKLDFIIDDGSHCDSQQQLAVDVLLPHLRPGGCFCVEDHDTLQPDDVYVKIPADYRLDIICKGRPWADSLLQVIRHV